MGIRPATPGTLVVATATVLLSIASATVPVIKSIYFLKAHIVITIQEGGGLTIPVDLSMGTFGYCITGDEISDICVGPTLGYTIDTSAADALLSITGSSANLLGDLPNDLIHWLTYALVVHPVAAGFAGIATICGLLSHIREFSITGFTTCFAVFGTILSLLAFVFDMVAFSIAKSRIASASNDTFQASAQLGEAIWLTLAAFILLLFSGCFFSFGRCIIRSKSNRQSEHDKWKPPMDPTYNNQMREDGIAAEKWRKEPSGGGSSFRRGKEGGLPAFAEFADQEHVPLTHFNQDDDEERVSGVGYGAPRQQTHQPANSSSSMLSSANHYQAGGYQYGYPNSAAYGTPNNAGYGYAPTPQPLRQGTGATAAPTPSGFRSMYDGPQQQSTQDYPYGASAFAPQQQPSSYASPPQRYASPPQTYASPPQGAAGLAYAGGGGGGGSSNVSAGAGYGARKQASQASTQDGSSGALHNPYGSSHGHERQDSVDGPTTPSSVYPPTELTHQGQGRGAPYNHYPSPPSQPPGYQ